MDPGGFFNPGDSNILEVDKKPSDPRVPPLTSLESCTSCPEQLPEGSLGQSKRPGN